MDVFDLRQRLVDDYQRYTRSFITIRDPRISAYVDQALGAGTFWPEPLLQLNPTFLPGGTIDTHVRHVLAQGGGDEALLRSMAAYMGTFRQLLDTCTGADMDALCVRYHGFYRFATLLERLAGGIADGSIPVPE